MFPAGFAVVMEPEWESARRNTNRYLQSTVHSGGTRLNWAGGGGGGGEAALTHLRFHFGFDMLIPQSLQSTSHLRLITLLIYIHTCDLSRPGATLAVLTADFQGKGA